MVGGPHASNIGSCYPKQAEASKTTQAGRGNMVKKANASKRKTQKVRAHGGNIVQKAKMSMQPIRIGTDCSGLEVVKKLESNPVTIPPRRKG